MTRKKAVLTYEIRSSVNASYKKATAVASVWTEKSGRWFFELHSDHATEQDAELAAIARAVQHAEEMGYLPSAAGGLI